MSADDKYDGCTEASARGDDDEVVRCACGSLLARYVAGQIELKCRRCKRTVMLSIETSPEGTGEA